PFHGKVACMDDEWATVGSSNLDPLSLALNLEANVVIRDRGFNRMLSGRLEQLMQSACREITVDTLEELKGWSWLRSVLAYHVARKYPHWAARLPPHLPILLPPAGVVRPVTEKG